MTVTWHGTPEIYNISNIQVKYTHIKPKTAKNKDRKNVSVLKRRKIYMFAYEGVLRGGEFSSNKKKISFGRSSEKIILLVYL